MSAPRTRCSPGLPGRSTGNDRVPHSTPSKPQLPQPHERILELDRLRRELLGVERASVLGRAASHAIQAARIRHIRARQQDALQRHHVLPVANTQTLRRPLPKAQGASAQPVRNDGNPLACRCSRPFHCRSIRSKLRLTALGTVGTCGPGESWERSSARARRRLGIAWDPSGCWHPTVGARCGVSSGRLIGPDPAPTRQAPT